MEKSFDKIELGDEQQEKEPKISYHFFYSPHGTREDVKEIKSLFEETDIYAPENYVWGEQEKKYLEDLSQGTIKPSACQNPALNYLDGLIYNSKKPIIIVDISKEATEIRKLFRSSRKIFEKSLGFFAEGKFDEAIEKIRLYVRGEAEANITREEKIKENIKNEIKKFLDNNPNYKNRKELKILISLGSLHTHLYKDLKAGNINLSHSFNQYPQIYSSADETIRRIIFDKEYNDELLAKIFVEDFLYDYLADLTDDSNKIDRLIRKLSSQLNISDIRQISENSGKNSKSKITEGLRSRGIEVPRSKKEIDKMLGIK